MKIRHEDIIIDEKEPFANCKLAREQYATVLTGIVNAYKDGFVMGINNEWGGGKTTFVKMWQKHLEIDGFKTIYFNAWENDFDTNPLVAIMAELEGLSKDNDEVFKSVVEKGAVFAKNIAPALIKAALAKYVDSEVLLESIVGAAKSATEIFEDEIKEHNKKKDTIKDFKEKLEEYVSSVSPNKPLIFIIDELDRCRPDYAVEVLENVKHLFSIKGITFVLSIDKAHLASSIRGYYGSEKINTDEYLRRFIDLEYSLPEPEPKLFIEYLYEYYGFDELSSLVNDEYSKNNIGIHFKYNVEALFCNSNPTLRQQESIFGLTRLIVTSFNSKELVYTNLLLTLIYLKFFHNEFYFRIKNKKLTYQELNDEYISIIDWNTANYRDEVMNNPNYIRGALLYTYSNSTPLMGQLFIIHPDHNEAPNNQYTTDTESLVKYTGTDETDLYLSAWFSQKSHRAIYDKLSIDFLFDRIRLMEPLLPLQDKK